MTDSQDALPTDMQAAIQVFAMPQIQTLLAIYLAAGHGLSTDC